MPSVTIILSIIPFTVGSGTIAANEKSRTMHPAVSCKIEKKYLS